MKKALIVVDMQKDFVDGSLGTPAAQSIVPAVAEKIRAFRGDALLVTLDTHGADYLQTLEGKKLPIPHCIKGTPGHALHSEIQAVLSGKPHTLVEKNTFGSFDVARLLAERFPGETPEIELGSARTSAFSPMRCSSAPPSRTPPSPWTPAAAPA